jgi:hypothetical protein
VPAPEGGKPDGILTYFGEKSREKGKGGRRGPAGGEGMNRYGFWAGKGTGDQTVSQSRPVSVRCCFPVPSADPKGVHGGPGEKERVLVHSDVEGRIHGGATTVVPGY